ncbi:MAG: hypothetical protein ABL868_05670 [Sulfuriferula sp.]
MSKDLEVALRLSLHGQQGVSAGLDKTRNQLRGLGAAAQGATAEFGRLYQAVNGFSAVSKGLARTLPITWSCGMLGRVSFKLLAVFCCSHSV